MYKILIAVFFVFFIASTGSRSFGQWPSSIHIESNSGLDAQIAQLMNELDLTFDQKISIGLIILKQSSTFNFAEFEQSSGFRRLRMIRSLVRRLDKDLKPILSKEQFRIYKKHKKKLKKELRKM